MLCLCCDAVHNNSKFNLIKNIQYFMNFIFYFNHFVLMLVDKLPYSMNSPFLNKTNEKKMKKAKVKILF